MVDPVNRHIGAGEVHHGLDTDHILHSVDDIESEIGGGSTGAPGDVAESRVVSDHALHSFEEVIDAIFGLGREEFEGEDDARVVGFSDLIYYLHILIGSAKLYDRRRELEKEEEEEMMEMEMEDYARGIAKDDDDDFLLVRARMYIYI